MEAISKVQVVGGLVGRGGAGHARDGSTASSGMGKEKERYLGDYVSRDKMLAVRDGCAKILGESPARRLLHRDAHETLPTAQLSSKNDPKHYKSL